MKAENQRNSKTKYKKRKAANFMWSDWKVRGAAKMEATVTRNSGKMGIANDKSMTPPKKKRTIAFVRVMGLYSELVVFLAIFIVVFD